MIIAGIAVQYGINDWNAYFFNALDRRDEDDVFWAIGLFIALVLLSSGVAVVQLIGRMRLQVQWRQWLTARLVGRWLEEGRFYRLSISAPNIDSPEFRIADDARMATEPVVNFASGIMNAVLTAAVFFGVLWTVGGSARIGDFEIPGFMMIAAVIYAVLMSGSMVVFGKPLIAWIETKNATEARLRHEMVRVRENAESIAMLGGVSDEQRGIGAAMQGVVGAWRGVIMQLAHMTWLTNTNSVAAPMVPLLLGAPNYLNGTMSLGALMQTAAAFVQVQVALNWLVDNYSGIAEWLASVQRVVGLWTALTDLDATIGRTEHDRIMIAQSPDASIRLEGLSVAQHNGRVMIEGADTVIERGDKVLLMGDSGTGKSTLIRAIAGMWPWGSGRVLLPPDARMAFVPQRAYIPQGSLRQVLQYPAAGHAADDEVLTEALHRCGLKRLIPRLDEVNRWEKLLSGGEQQRIAFARLLVHRPQIVIMDEATAALDIDSQDAMMDMFNHELADVTLISVGHRAELEEYHNRKLTLIRTRTGVEMRPERDNTRRRRLAALLRRALRPRPVPDPSAPGDD
jgi:putative ATP-binding cassette transporter